jgi:hypothetical protein
MNKVAIVCFLLCLAAVPAFSLRYRVWDQNSKCRGGESSILVYSNNKEFCQPAQDSGTTFIKVISDCKNGKSTSIQRYTDGTCATPLSDPFDSPVINNGDCISYTVTSQSSYIVDCNSAATLAPGLVALIALLALLFL